jgi:hypothetical protein
VFLVALTLFVLAIPLTLVMLTWAGGGTQLGWMVLGLTGLAVASAVARGLVVG